VAGYARRLVALLDALAIPRAAVAGHSLGGAIALQLALDAPDRVAGLLLVGTGARLRVLRAVLEATADPARAAEAAAAVAAACFAPGADPGMVRDLARGMAAAAPGILHGDLRACDGFDVMERLPGIRAPAVVVCGEGDRLTPPRYAGFLAASLPRSTLRMVPGAGHMVAWEAPGAVVAAAEELLAEIS
jgi:pimeloyl-ACP methyl ester carboxylesterase